MSSTTYFQHFRSDVLRHIPDSVERVLSVGCGAGVTEAALVERGAAVTGIEMHPGAAEAARERGLEVLACDVDAAESQLGDRTFDCLIYADVLEHLPEPELVLQRHVARLEAGGIVVISVPNFRYFTVLWQLAVRGGVTYTDSGILDRTHLRITTRSMAESWVQQSGLEDIAHEYRLTRRRDRMLAAAGLGQLDGLFAQQIIVTGRKAA